MELAAVTCALVCFEIRRKCLLELQSDSLAHHANGINRINEGLSVCFPIDEGGEDLSRAARESAGWEKANFEANSEKLRRIVD